MKKFSALLAALAATLTVASAVLADNMNNMKTDHMMMGGKKVTLTGQVVDLSCYVGSGFKGAKHKACAKACLLNGNEFGILKADGNIVSVFGTGPNDKPNQKVLPFVEERVTVTGEQFTGHGVTGIRIDSISAAR